MYFLGFSRYSNCNERIISPRNKAQQQVCGIRAYQSVLFPCYCLVLVRVGVGEAFDLAGFTPEEAVEVGSDFVALAFAEGVTLGASCLKRRVRSLY